MVHVNYEFLMKIEDAEKACWQAYLSGAQILQGNPFGIHFSNLGKSTAFLVKSSSSQFFNKTLGFGVEHLENLQDLFDFYHNNEKMCTIELIPSPDDETLLLTLARNGLYNCGHSVMLYKSIDSEISEKKDIEVKQVGKNETRLLAEIHVQGFEFQGDDAEQEYKIVEEGYKHKNFHSFIAMKDGQMIGAGSLFIHHDVGILFGGATIPKYRGMGGQRALLEHRINFALNQGCKVLASHTTLYSASQRNLERVGFRIACIRSRWSDYPL